MLLSAEPWSRQQLRGRTRLVGRSSLPYEDDPAGCFLVIEDISLNPPDAPDAVLADQALRFRLPSPPFLRERVHWVELLTAAKDPAASPLPRALALLVQPEEEIPGSSTAIQAEVAGTGQEGAIADVIAAIVVTRFNGRTIPELCAMGGITLEEFTQSVAYQEIFGQGREEGRQEGRQQGRQEGRQEGELELALRLLRRRCGDLTPHQVARIRALPLERLEALAEALLDFQNPRDLDAWLGIAA